MDKGVIQPWGIEAYLGSLPLFHVLLAPFTPSVTACSWHCYQQYWTGDCQASYIESQGFGPSMGGLMNPDQGWIQSTTWIRLDRLRLTWVPYPVHVIVATPIHPPAAVTVTDCSHCYQQHELVTKSARPMGGSMDSDWGWIQSTGPRAFKYKD